MKGSLQQAVRELAGKSGLWPLEPDDDWDVVMVLRTDAETFVRWLERPLAALTPGWFVPLSIVASQFERLSVTVIPGREDQLLRERLYAVLNERNATASPPLARFLLQPLSASSVEVRAWCTKERTDFLPWFVVLLRRIADCWPEARPAIDEAQSGPSALEGHGVASDAALRLHIDGIDSFAAVRDVPSEQVRELLVEGYLDVSEDFVQSGLEKILNVPFHKKDWGGETDDLYTANLEVGGRRVPTAFLLKGHGLKSRELRIKDCGANADQLLRLFEAPAELFVVQYVGVISEAVVKDVQGKANERRSRGGPARFCIIDGQDTARLLRAYGLR
jgi:hypothetical protein